MCVLYHSLLTCCLTSLRLQSTMWPSSTMAVLPAVPLQLVMGGRYYSISPDEYIFAALNIYLVSHTQHSRRLPGKRYVHA